MRELNLDINAANYKKEKLEIAQELLKGLDANGLDRVYKIMRGDMKEHKYDYDREAELVRLYTRLEAFEDTALGRNEDRKLTEANDDFVEASIEYYRKKIEEITSLVSYMPMESGTI